jgi:NADPH-dependent 2,4-dienoyl-CoA reductase/sulfur reductase-like enzyme
MVERILIVGASLAGVHTAQALRRKGSEAELALVGDEPGALDGVAADRPPLSKKFLADPATEAPPLISRAALDELGVRLVTARATDLDLGARRVALHGGDNLAFDALVIATGSTPRTLPELEPRSGVFVLRTATDAAAIRSGCSPGSRVVVIGGGFIGSEAAWTLHARGHEVTIVEPLPSLMVRGLGPHIGTAFTRRHAEAGIQLRLGSAVSAIEGTDRVQGVRLVDGTLLRADVVVLGLGTVPETAWLADSGLDLRDGVVCDGHLAAAGAEGVYAVGDVARWRHPRYAEDVRVEHWTNAIETADVVAANLTGTPTLHDSPPYVWTEQLGGRLQVSGRVRPQDEMQVVYGDLDGAFVALSGGDGFLQSVISFAAVKQMLPFRELLAAGARWKDALAAA